MDSSSKNLNLIDIDVISIYALENVKHIQLIQNKKIYSLSFDNQTKMISKAEYAEILSMVHGSQDGRQTIILNEQFEWFLNKYWHNRDNDRLERIGVALYGPSWKRITALELNIDERRLTHWLQATRQIPPETWDKLHKLALKRQNEISAAMLLLPPLTTNKQKKVK